PRKPTLWARQRGRGTVATLGTVVFLLAPQTNVSRGERRIVHHKRRSPNPPAGSSTTNRTNLRRRREHECPNRPNRPATALAPTRRALLRDTRGTVMVVPGQSTVPTRASARCTCDLLRGRGDPGRARPTRNPSRCRRGSAALLRPSIADRRAACAD